MFPDVSGRGSMFKFQRKRLKLENLTSCSINNRKNEETHIRNG
jgi:hypothetical protein